MADLSRPPTGLDFVDMRLNVDKVDRVSTVEETAHFVGTLVLTWTDPRVQGMTNPPPAGLWGPWIRLANALTSDPLQQVEFELLDSSTGRLKRGIRVDATVPFTSDLTNFPFDLSLIHI